MNLIMDTVHFTDTDEEIGLKKWLEVLRDNPVLFVLVTCPLEELRRREKERGDREIGQGEGQIATLYPQEIYDITIDNYKNTNEECADRIIELIDCPENFTAFKTLWSQMRKDKI
jgi:chloramphenicol 3-O phosphotransferase